MIKHFTLLFMVGQIGLAAEIHKDFNLFFDAVSQVESRGKVGAYNKEENAIGIVQIRKLYFLDAQSQNKNLRNLRHENCYCPVVSKKVMLAYFAKYERKALKEGNWEILAKLHNSGLGWRTKPKNVQKRLDIYWKKVLNELKKKK